MRWTRVSHLPNLILSVLVCDICNDNLPKEADKIQNRISVLDKIDESFESEYDKHEPRLLLCSSCSLGSHDSQLLHLGNESYNQLLLI